PETQIFLYKEGLKDEVRKSLAYVTGLVTFSDLVAKSIEIDQTLFEMAKAAKKEAAKKEAAKKEPSKSQNPAPPSSSSNRAPQPRNFSLSPAVMSSRGPHRPQASPSINAPSRSP